MSEERETVVESGPLDLQAPSSMEVSGTVVSGSVIAGDQAFEWAESQVRVATAAHQREMERQRVEREHQKEIREEDETYKDRQHQRIRDNCTYAVVVLLIVGGLGGSFIVAASSSDPTQQVWAQSLTTTIAGAVGGAFAGYLIGGRK